jgi:hypothetical protein
MEGRVFMTADEIVQRVSDAHKRLDAALQEAREASLDIERATEDWISSQPIGGLKAKKALHMARALTGAIATAADKSADAHFLHHGVATDAKIATDPLTTIGGITPMGGTR